MLIGHWTLPLIGILISIDLLAGIGVQFSNLDRLTRLLTSNYNKLLIPAGIGGKAEDQVLTLDAWLMTSWLDNQLTWNPGKYGNITTVRLPSKLLWQPDIILYNNADVFQGLHRGDFNMVVTYDGAVFYNVPTKIKSYCKMRTSGVYKKHEPIRCYLKFGSWTYDGSAMNVTSAPSVDLSDFDRGFNKHWNLQAASVKRNVLYFSCCAEPYIDILYTLILKPASPKRLQG